MDYKMLKPRIDFLNKYSFFSNFSRNAQVKLASRIKEVAYSFNQRVYLEGDDADYIYFIKSGQFEVTKDIYIKQSEKGSKIGFRRIVVNPSESIMHKYFSHHTQIFISTDQNELKKLKRGYKDSVNNKARL
jgi:CRP-like cAMP-binding protein